jgi:membrane associated rhomboid family serine protease
VGLFVGSIEQSAMKKITVVKEEEEEIDLTKPWDDVCEWVEKKLGPTGEFLSQNVLRHISVNAPVILGFCSLCTFLYAIRIICWQNQGRILGVHDYWRFSILQFTSLFSHVLAHSSYDHLRGNMMHLLLVGPSVEHEFGSRNLFYIILLVAVSSALAHILVGQGFTHQLGASGVVFACILLNSLVSASSGKIPMSFVITFWLYIGDELYKFFFAGDATSHHAHLVGGMVGAAAGFKIHQRRVKEMTRNVLSKWKRKKKSR